MTSVTRRSAGACACCRQRRCASWCHSRRARRPTSSPPGVVLSAGLATTAAGLAIMRGLTVSSSWTALVPGLLLVGFGVGIANPAIAKIALGVVPPQRAGMASGISNTFRTAGLATGVASLGAIFQHHLATSLQAQLGHPAAGLATALASAGTRAAQKHRSGPARSPSPPRTRRSCRAPMSSWPSGPSSFPPARSPSAALVRARDFHNQPHAGAVRAADPAAETV